MPASYFIAKLYRQHKSIVMAVPQPVYLALGLKPGDHVLLTWDNDTGTFNFQKFVPEGAKDADNREHTDTEDRSRATQTANGR